MPVSIQMDRGDLTRLKMTMAAIGKSYGPVLSRAINKTLTGTRTDSVNEIWKTLNLTKTRIRNDFNLYKAYSSRPSGSVVAKGKPVGLISFGARELKSGFVSVKVHRTQSPTKLRHAFIASASGARNVFERVNYGRQPFKPYVNYAALPRKYRYPLERLTGPRIEDEFAKETVIRPVQEMAGDRLSKNVDSQIDYEWSKLP